jgi:hypothetical protein
LAIRFRGASPDLQIELIVERSRLVELRLVENETGDHFAFSRAQILDDPEIPPGSLKPSSPDRAARRPKACSEENSCDPSEIISGHAGTTVSDRYGGAKPSELMAANETVCKQFLDPEMTGAVRRLVG